MRGPEIRDQRKWRPKEEMEGNGRAREAKRERGREGERKRVLKKVPFVCKMV